MSFPIFQKPERRDPYASARQLALGGINQAVENDVISKLLKRIKDDENPIDPLTAILESGLSGERQKQLIDAFQNSADIQRKGQTNDLIQGLLQNRTPGAFSSEQAGSSISDNQFLNESFDPSGQPQIDQGNTALENLTDNELSALSAYPDPNVRSLVQFEQNRRIQKEKRFISDRDFNTKSSQKYVDRINDERNSTRQKVSAGNQLVSAIETGDTDIWSSNNLARITGIDAFRDASGQQFVTAGKEYFLANLSRVKGRPNQYLEEQLSSALPNLGQSKNSQMVAAKMALADSEIASKEIEIADRLIQQDMARSGFVRADLAQRVNQELKPIADEIDRNLSYDIRKLQEKDMGIDKVKARLGKKVPQGSVITPSTLTLFIRKHNGDTEKAIREAKRLGWDIPTPEQFRAYEGSYLEQGAGEDG